MAEFEMTVSQMLEIGDGRSPAGQNLMTTLSPDSLNQSPEHVNVAISSPVRCHSNLLLILKKVRSKHEIGNDLTSLLFVVFVTNYKQRVFKMNQITLLIYWV